MNYLYLLLALVLAPVLPGVVNQTKAFFAGRRGPGLFRLYFDLAKLMRKSCPRSSTAVTVAAAALFPWTLDATAPCAAVGVVPFFYLLGTGRFFTVLGALDTGSAFEGMGASREVQFSALVEPIVFVVLGFLVLLTGETSFALLSGCAAGSWLAHPVPLALAGLAFFAILLSENCRVPFDDPETHLELTMIHEAMILDYSGPDLALILYTASLKLWLFSAFVVMLVFPIPVFTPLFYVATLAMGLVIGAVESSMARMRFTRTPFVLACAFACAVLALVMEALVK